MLQMRIPIPRSATNKVGIRPNMTRDSRRTWAGRSRQEGRTVAYLITEACLDLKDKTCVSQRPVDCIYEGPRMLYIQPDECIDCGAREIACPMMAIVPTSTW